MPDEYLFSRSEAETHLRGSDTIRHILRECGAKHPETLSSTKLRKHISMPSTVLNLQDNEMDILANFLEHDMTALEQGRMSDFKGMSSDQIQIDPNGKYCFFFLFIFFCLSFSISMSVLFCPSFSI